MASSTSCGRPTWSVPTDHRATSATRRFAAISWTAATIDGGRVIPANFSSIRALTRWSARARSFGSRFCWLWRGEGPDVLLSPLSSPLSRLSRRSMITAPVPFIAPVAPVARVVAVAASIVIVLPPNAQKSNERRSRAKACARCANVCLPSRLPEEFLGIGVVVRRPAATLVAKVKSETVVAVANPRADRGIGLLGVAWCGLQPGLLPDTLLVDAIISILPISPLLVGSDQPPPLLNSWARRRERRSKRWGETLRSGDVRSTTELGRSILLSIRSSSLSVSRINIRGRRRDGADVSGTSSTSDASPSVSKSDSDSVSIRIVLLDLILRVARRRVRPIGLSVSVASMAGTAAAIPAAGLAASHCSQNHASSGTELRPTQNV